MMKGLIILMSVLNAVAFAAKFPLNQRKCRHSDSACFVNLANEIILKGKQGYPELGLPVFDPLKIEKMNIEQGGAGPVNLKIQLRNFDLRGLSNVRFHKIDGFPERFEKAKMEFRFLYPVMHIQGPYKLEGRVLVLPVQGDGIANLTFYDNETTLKLLTKKVTRNGKSYLHVEKSKLNFETPRIKVHFANLFNGNRELGETTNLFFNDNWKDILKEIKPAICDSISAIYESVLNNVFGSIPYDDMFLS